MHPYGKDRGQSVKESGSPLVQLEVVGYWLFVVGFFGAEKGDRKGFRREKTMRLPPYLFSLRQHREDVMLSGSETSRERQYCVCIFLGESLSY